MSHSGFRLPHILGDYELLTKIGEGGVGIVYRGRRMSDDRTVAVKVLWPDMATNEVLLRRFEQEFQTAAKLQHPAWVQALDFCGELPSPFLVMEFVDGRSLGELLERQRRLLEEDAVRLATQVCEGLHFLHQHSMVHRDVKPDNVLVTNSGEAKLTDLGLVKAVMTDQQLTRTGRGLGTPHFMAPEQFRNAKQVDARADVYSVGATLYMLVTGKLPFAGLSPLDCWTRKVKGELPPARSLAPSLSPQIDRLIGRAMAADPDERPSSCEEFAQELRDACPMATTPKGEGAKEPTLYLSYEDADGEPYCLKLQVEKVRTWVSTGRLSEASNLRASRTAGGTFEPLGQFPELRGLRLPPEKAPGEKRASKPKKKKSAKASAEAKPPTRSRGPWQTALMWLFVALATLVAGLMVFLW